ncbi:MAG TPA: spore germination protein [Cyanobacteria bacterium UBA8803]|nr:spore germination protein [Cyanobacteria bacterium UBA9273]HBL61515.1 spore germination protein [Cyanobacteria bacterium UBA8803]
MENQQPARRIPVGVAAGLSAAILAAGSGGAWWMWNSLTSSTTPPVVNTSPSPQSAQTSTAQKVQVYWLDEADTQIKLVPSSITLENVNNQREVLEGAFHRLLAGPTEGTASSTIPQGTRLRNISIASDGVHVDLSPEFTSGGGSASMMGRLAQVLYTATSLDPTAKVWIDVEGKPLEELGGEGIVVDRPMTRKIFEQEFGESFKP